MSSPERISLLTWNILMGGLLQLHRLDGISSVITELSCPDVICLQEVTHLALDCLSQAWWWPQYYSSKDARKHREASVEVFTLLLLKKSTFSSISSFVNKLFPNSVMERGLLAVRAHGHGSDFCFVVTHLESPMGKLLKQWLGQQRVEQAMQTFQLMSGFQDEVMVAGDMNWIEEDHGPCMLPDGWCDPWEVLKPKDAPGYTYDSLKNRMVPLNFYRSRLDRVWCKLHQWRPVHVELVGQSRLKGIACLDFKALGKHLPILPSDHFGVYVQFVKQS